ncbi:DivIVA domain-containing protein [Nocardioides sp. HDW12B]|uniref:DivIVA domain-containing protein n=1 Tax=Nocardioides sp. HDW12B TaxID=2714939 RepID=UPI001408D29A|nr:DivIVA domain-containing protein [Nocardioides sp. HDW12B]QIK67449.1 DivIVA domain-containing protein [Nocardioides sp. HDW12B]
MTWFFALLVMAVLGVVAVVAVGRGGGLEETFDDRPDPRVPDGPLSASDLRRVRFTTAFRGYRMSEVDALLERLAVQVDDARGAPGTTGGDARSGTPGGDARSGTTGSDARSGTTGGDARTGTTE